MKKRPVNIDKILHLVILGIFRYKKEFHFRRKPMIGWGGEHWYQINWIDTRTAETCWSLHPS